MERQKVQGIQFSEGGFVSRRQAALGTAVEQPGASVEKDLKGCSIGTARQQCGKSRLAEPLGSDALLFQPL